MTAVKSADITLLETVDDVGADRAAEIEAIHEVLHGVRGPFQVLLHCPGLAEKVMRAGAHIRLQSTLTPRQRQLVIAALARAISCNYEWAAHVDNARKAGIEESTLELIRTGGDIDELPEGDDRDICRFVTQLVVDHRVDPALRRRLVERHGERWLVEIVATVGQYSYIGAVLNAFDVEPDVDPGAVLA